MTRRTRKVRRTNRQPQQLYLQNMSNKHGNSTATFKTVCNPEAAHAQMLVTNSLKVSDPDNNSVFHIAKLAVNNKDYVVKLQHAHYAPSIYTRLRGINNVVQMICDFKCNFNPIVWTKPLVKPRPICDAQGIEMHVLIMEYINTDLHDFLKQNTNDAVLESLVKQVGFGLMGLILNHRITNGDVSLGNLLVHIDNNPKMLTYKIGRHTVSVNTLGHEFKLIDFERGGVLNDTTNINIAVLNDVSTAYDWMYKWANHAPHKDALRTLSTYVSNHCISLEDLFQTVNIFKL